MSHEQVPLPQCGEADLSDTSAALEDSLVCQNHSCPVDYCYNQGHCYISQALDCQPMCTCPPAFIDTQCLLAGNSFTPTVHGELPLRVIQLSLRESENASEADVNASVAYRLDTLDVPAFLQNSQVQLINGLRKFHSTLVSHLRVPVPPLGPSHLLPEQSAASGRGGGLPPGSDREAEEEPRAQEQHDLLQMQWLQGLPSGLQPPERLHLRVPM
uniref:Uncharacterized protein n=1 Tax=Castor canadensis TaxID=51338 RepID=A0A8C0W3Y2_CASCN